MLCEAIFNFACQIKPTSQMVSTNFGNTYTWIISSAWNFGWSQLELKLIFLAWGAYLAYSAWEEILIKNSNLFLLCEPCFWLSEFNYSRTGKNTVVAVLFRHFERGWKTKRRTGLRRKLGSRFVGAAGAVTNVWETNVSASRDSQPLCEDTKLFMHRGNDWLGTTSAEREKNECQAYEKQSHP